MIATIIGIDGEGYHRVGDLRSIRGFSNIGLDGESGENIDEVRHRRKADHGAGDRNRTADA